MGFNLAFKGLIFFSPLIIKGLGHLVNGLLEEYKEK